MFYEINEKTIPMIPDAPGCYWLVKKIDKGSPHPIGRVSGIDQHGILYIGQSKSLRNRFKEMLKQFNSKTTEVSAIAKAGHPASYEWHISSRNKISHPLNTIFYVFEKIDKSEDTVKKELIYLTNYRDMFGEYPPWNQSPSNFKKYLPVNNPQGFAPLKFDYSCDTWLPPIMRNK
ncbi:MAG: hypothetical protein RBT64_11280 [Trichloromonas sp.]|nr:hypothetical protein [Trichloromonas sp.]